jgi:hypothetical protein
MVIAYASVDVASVGSTVHVGSLDVNVCSVKPPAMAVRTAAANDVASVVGTLAGVLPGRNADSRVANPLVTLLTALLAFVLAVLADDAVPSQLVTAPLMLETPKPENIDVKLLAALAMAEPIDVNVDRPEPLSSEPSDDSAEDALVFAVDAVDAVPVRLVPNVPSVFVVPPVTRLISGPNTPELVDVGVRKLPRPPTVLTPGIRPRSVPKMPDPDVPGSKNASTPETLLTPGMPENSESQLPCAVFAVVLAVFAVDCAPSAVVCAVAAFV